MAVSTPEKRGPNAGWEFASCGMSGFIWHTVRGWRIDQLGAFSRTAVRKETEAARRAVGNDTRNNSLCTASILAELAG